MNMTLESLLEDLEKQATLTKSASDESDKQDEKDAKEKAEKKSEDKAKSEIGSAKEELDKAEKDVEKAEQTKEAQFAGAALAQEIMQKVASVQLSTKETQMNKQAAFAGKALADALLEKLASAGDISTSNGIPEGVAPNKNQIDVAQLVAEQDAIIKPMPTGDGIRNTGTINQIFDSIVADALGQGAASYDQVHTTGVSAQEGAVEAHAVPNQVPNDSVEKTAAVISLVNSGIDFDDAVSLVKSAADQIEFEEGEQIKQAAFANLVDAGVDFNLAAAMVKSAGAQQMYETARGAAAKGYEGARALASDAYGSVKANGISAKRNFDGLVSGKYDRMDAAKALAKNPLVYGGAAGLAAAGGAGVYALGREKQSAVSELCAAGVDFESAVELVQAKSQELYGA